MKHLLLTFRREEDGSLFCIAPVGATQLNKTLEQILQGGYSVEAMVQGRDDDDVDILLLLR